MKRLSFLVLFFYCCTFVHPPLSRAVAPLAVLAPAVIGAAIVGVAGTQYALQNPSGGFSFDGQSIITPIVAYNKLMIGGAEVALGKAATAVLDIKKSYDSGVLAYYPGVWQKVQDFFADPTYDPDAPPGVDDVVPTSCGNKKIISSFTPPNPTDCAGGAWLSDGGIIGCTATTVTFAYAQPYCGTNAGTTFYKVFVLQAVSTTDPVDYPSPPPSSLPGQLDPSSAPGLADHIAQQIPSSPELAQELEDLLKNHPQLWAFPDTVSLPSSPSDISDYPPAQPITPSEINSWAQGQSAGAQQNYIDTLQDLVAANPTNAELAAELARAQAEQAQQQAEDAKDTFDPISSSPFDAPYTTDAFDIPARFTSFLNNVKSTGLFSFSSSFFNSLPGGGSPIYTVDAGTYGTHTIDLSETMATGLAVLKTVLLLLFGFLSIRVVILKR